MFQWLNKCWFHPRSKYETVDTATCTITTYDSWFNKKLYSYPAVIKLCRCKKCGKEAAFYVDGSEYEQVDVDYAKIKHGLKSPEKEK